MHSRYLPKYLPSLPTPSSFPYLPFLLFSSPASSAITHPSQMLRGSVIIFTGLLSRFYLRRELKSYQWVSSVTEHQADPLLWYLSYALLLLLLLLLVSSVSHTAIMVFCYCCCYFVCLFCLFVSLSFYLRMSSLLHDHHKNIC